MTLPLPHHTRPDGRRPLNAGIRAERTRRVAALLALLAFAAGGCGSDAPTEVAGVPGAVPYAALAAYPFWWSLVEACSGLHGDLAAVRWSSVPGDSLPGREGPAQGQWAPDRNEITVIAKDTAAGPLIRHEMLHALVGSSVNYHSPLYFGARCGGYVVCASACATEVAAGTSIQAAAPAVRPDDLIVRAQLVTPASGTGAAGGTFAFLVTVENPRGTPGWVPRSANVNAGETPDFGYALTRPLFSYGELDVAQGARTYFAAGETKHFIFDAHVGDFVPGTYQLQGSFSGASSAPTTVTLPP